MNLTPEPSDRRDHAGPIVPAGGRVHPLDASLQELQERYQVIADATVLHGDAEAMARSSERLRALLHERPCSLCRERCQFC